MEPETIEVPSSPEMSVDADANITAIEPRRAVQQGTLAKGDPARQAEGILARGDPALSCGRRLLLPWCTL